MVALEAENIEVRPVWKPKHMQLVFEGCKFYPDKEDDVVSERLFVEGNCLPSGSNMTVDEQGKVIKKIKLILAIVFLNRIKSLAASEDAAVIRVKSYIF